MQKSILNNDYEIKNCYDSNSDLILYHGDNKDFLSTIPDKSLSLIITSPPYNMGKEYEKNLSIEEYLVNQSSIIKEFYRILKDDGHICWQVGNYVKDGEVYPLDIYYYPIFKNFNFRLRNRIIWHFGHGLHASKRFSGRYETILWFSKTDNYYYNLDAVRVPAKYPGKRHYKGEKKGQISGNPQGKNPSDYWEIVLQDWEKEIWEIPNVKSNHPEKTIHPCQYPIELVERCVLALTKENDRVFDPFAGVGSSIIASIKHKRKAIGCEQKLEYINVTIDRINKYYNNDLKIRPLGKIIHKPTGKEKVSQIPPEWQEEKSIYQQLNLLNQQEKN
ncbi:MAG: site-specific DNA-methyltransferase [Cyanobacterium sp. T60_A2020_053]|nr:site-specific DNA-methyltransferase [Cyanobacterium sp. T60_A2020_053]